MDELAEAIRVFPQTQDEPGTIGLTQDCLGIGVSLRTFRRRISEFVENSQPVMATITLEGKVTRTYITSEANYYQRSILPSQMRHRCSSHFLHILTRWQGHSLNSIIS